jgi:hypothetical protein
MKTEEANGLGQRRLRRHEAPENLVSWQSRGNDLQSALVSLATSLSRPIPDTCGLPEFSKTRASCEIQVTVGKDVGTKLFVSEFFIAARFANASQLH